MSATFYRLVQFGGDGKVALVSDHMSRLRAKKRGLRNLRHAARLIEAGDRRSALPVTWRVERHQRGGASARLGG